MVTHKKILISLLFIIITLLTSCNLYKRFYKRNDCNRVRTKVNFNLAKVNKDFYKLCDTSGIYKYAGEFYLNNKKQQIFTNKKLTKFFKFYANGKVGEFGMKNNSLQKEDLNPCNAQYGYYGIKKNKVILKQFVVTEQQGEYNFTYLIIFKKDTLELINKNLPEYKYIYTYIPIPQDWLKYTPDW